MPPKVAAEFVFHARNPGPGEIWWKAHQHFSDDPIADWAGAAARPQPAQ